MNDDKKMISNTTCKTISIRLDIASYDDVIAYCKRNHLMVSEAMRPIIRREFGQQKPAQPVKAELRPSKPVKPKQKPSKPVQAIEEEEGFACPFPGCDKEYAAKQKVNFNSHLQWHKRAGHKI